MDDLIMFMVSLFGDAIASKYKTLCLNIAIGSAVAFAAAIMMIHRTQDDGLVRWVALAAFLAYSSAAFLWTWYRHRRPQAPSAGDDLDVRRAAESNRPGADL